MNLALSWLLATSVVLAGCSSPLGEGAESDGEHTGRGLDPIDFPVEAPELTVGSWWMYHIQDSTHGEEPVDSYEKYTILSEPSCNSEGYCEQEVQITTFDDEDGTLVEDAFPETVTLNTAEWELPDVRLPYDIPFPLEPGEPQHGYNRGQGPYIRGTSHVAQVTVNTEWGKQNVVGIDFVDNRKETEQRKTVWHNETYKQFYSPDIQARVHWMWNDYRWYGDRYDTVWSSADLMDYHIA